MEFLNKLGSFAKTATEKAGGAVEVTKLNAQILAQKKKISDGKEKLGDYIYTRFAAGEQLDDGIMAVCREIKAEADACEALQEQARNAKDNLLHEKDELKIMSLCQACSTQNPAGSKTCENCGANLE